MIGRLLKSSDQGWLKVLVSVMALALLGASLLYLYGQPVAISLIDGVVYTLMVGGGMMLLENIFRFYQPQRGNYWLLVVLPVIMSGLVVAVGNLVLAYLLKSKVEYLVFLEYSIYIRAAFVLFFLGGYTALLMIGGMLEDQLETRKREEMVERLSKEAELYHLRQQLQPHFLFNSLNSISALVKRHPERAREMVLQLSGFLRGTIRKNELDWISVEEEVKTLQLFLQIEKVRFGHRLEVRLEVEESAKAMTLPPLLIQPLLENAVKHGIYGVTDQVVIGIQVRANANFLEITVSNPFDPHAVHEKGAGFGLESVRRRLFLLFGRNDLLMIKSTDELFEVNLKIPAKYDQDVDN